MIFDFLLIFIAFYLTIPFVCGYFAISYNKPFWIWFALGLFLPVIAHFILYFVVTYELKNNKPKVLLTKAEHEHISGLIDGLIADPSIKKKKKWKKDKYFNY
ncbi:MAG TPA: hypothetical protein ACFCUD_14360 [Cyclobacteriaceae bacterium]